MLRHNYSLKHANLLSICCQPKAEKPKKRCGTRVFHSRGRIVGISDIGLLLLIICIIIILFPQVSVTFFLLGSHTFAIIPKSILRLGDDFGESGELLSQVVPEHKTLSPTCNYRNNYMLMSVKFQPLS